MIPRSSQIVLVAALRPALVTGALVSVLGGLGTFAQAILLSPVMPDLDLCARLAGAATLATFSVAIPVGVLAGLHAGLRRLRDEGSWLALGTFGVSGRALAAPVLLWALVGGGAWALVSHEGEPRARAWLRDLRVDAAVRVRPQFEEAVRLGEWSVATAGDTLVFAGADHVGTATRWRLDPAANAVVATLEDVELRDWRGGGHAHIDRVVMPFGLSSAGAKIHASERTTPDLVHQIALSDTLGRGGYERWLLWKRTILPLCILPLALAALPLSLGARRPSARVAPVAILVGAEVLSVWGVVRVVDQRIESLDLATAAAIVLVVASAWPLLAWSRWADR